MFPSSCLRWLLHKPVATICWGVGTSFLRALDDCECSRKDHCVTQVLLNKPAPEQGQASSVHTHICREERFDQDVDILEAADVPLYSSDDEADAHALSNLPVVIEASRTDPDPPAAVIEAPVSVATRCERASCCCNCGLFLLGMLCPQTAVYCSFFCSWCSACVRHIAGLCMRA